jgi:hypothetical protein
METELRGLIEKDIDCSRDFRDLDYVVSDSVSSEIY